MTIHLGASVIDDRHIRLHWAQEPVTCLSERGGRSSPIFALPGTTLTQLPTAGSLAFLYPHNPRELFAALLDDAPAEVVAGLFMSHGLACCIIVVEPDFELYDFLTQTSCDYLHAFEIWPFEERRSNVTSAKRWTSANTSFDIPAPIDSMALPEPIAQEVRQFNANLALLANSAREFVPEFQDLTQWLHESISSRVEHIRSDIRAGASIHALSSKLHHDVSILVDVNSCLTLVISQALSVLPPLLSSTYPVGEFSLLGIGSASRAVWRFYETIATVFARADHVTRLRNAFQTPGFDPWLDRTIQDNLTSWTAAAERSIQLSPAPDMRPGRKHLIYFSSRWGFHETLNSISVSWQSISAGAARHWNVLTLTHEFLHSHFRELVRANVLDVTDLAQLEDVAKRYNETVDSGWKAVDSFTFLDAFQIFLIHQLSLCYQADQWHSNSHNTAARAQLEVRHFSSQELAELINDYMSDFLEEFVVHIMDFHYFYDADDAPYLSALWHSWSLVPFVHKRLSHYLLRCLLALASTSDTLNAEDAYDNAARRLYDFFTQMAEETENPIATEAINTIKGKRGEELWKRFNYSFRLVPFVRTFLIDPKINALLTTDPLMTSGQEYTGPRGVFPSDPIRSPSAFLLDAYVRDLPDDPEIQARSLWQLLMIV